jgi:hypothetical protein
MGMDFHFLTGVCSCKVMTVIDLYSKCWPQNACINNKQMILYIAEIMHTELSLKFQF